MEGHVLEGFEVSKAHTISSCLSLPRDCDMDVNLSPTPAALCLPAPRLSASVITDSPSETVSKPPQKTLL